jgi:hypothetical protein
MALCTEHSRSKTSLLDGNQASLEQNIEQLFFILDINGEVFLLRM